MENSAGPAVTNREENQLDDTASLSRSSPTASHSEAVQALRKYLLRKMSSEESSGDKELECTPERVISVAESNGSKLYCSLVQRPVEPVSTQGSKKFLAKHKSLDLDDSTFASAGLRYLRTDLCIPVLWSKCSFCDDFFETEEQLRKHLRDSHFQYFSNYIQMRPLASTKSLSDLPFSSALRIGDSSPPPPPTSFSSMFPENGVNELLAFQGSRQHCYSQFVGSASRKPVKCEVCGKNFTTKWNCKQHLKCHAKESSSGASSGNDCPMDTTSSSFAASTSSHPYSYSSSSSTTA